MRRRVLAIAVLIALAVAVVVVVTGSGEDGDTARSEGASDRPEPPPELPRGGRRLFPDFRVVAFYGAPQNEALGALGVGTPTRAGRRLRRQARPYERRRRPVLPAMELIAVVASASPGRDGQYSYRQREGTIRRYLRAARRARALLILDIQPGRAGFIDETRALRRWLREPDVGLALDPEWHVGRGQVPGQQLGSVTAREVNEVSAYVADIVRRHRLPQKLLLVHQFTPSMIRGRGRLRARPELALTVNVDGFGTKEVKRDVYDQLAGARDRLHDGIKVFYEEDTGLLSPRELLALSPRPDVVVYE